MRNKFLKLFLIVSLLLFSGTNFAFCKHKLKPYIVFSSGQITQDSLKNIEKTFSVGQKINFLVYNPQGFSSNLVRIQILMKKGENAPWGISMAHARDIEVDTTKPYFIDDVVIWQSGYYIFRVFTHDKFETPFVETDFWIK